MSIMIWKRASVRGEEERRGREGERGGREGERRGEGEREEGWNGRTELDYIARLHTFLNSE